LWVQNENCDYKKIRYNETVFNNFKEFSFGHDGLLVIAIEMIKKYPLLVKIINDKFDIIFIDEFQDTNYDVLKVFLDKIAFINTTVGLFGDEMQAIYKDGIGSVKEYTDNRKLVLIEKPANYRCSYEVVDLIKKIRSDKVGIDQEVVLKQNEKESDRHGSVKLYYSIVDKKPVIKSDKNEKEEYAYQTSWGISTRLIGAIIMAHGDNRGLKLPPEIAPIQAIIVPISLSNEDVISKAKELFDVLNKNFRVEIDKRDNYSTGYKFNDWEMKGVPVRIEIGPKDILENQCMAVERDTGDKTAINLDNIEDELRKILSNIQKRMFDSCKKNKENRTSSVDNLDEFAEKINKNQGYIKAMWCGDEKCEAEIRDKTGAKSRCIPFKQEKISDKCVVCGKKAKHLVFWGRQY